MKCGATTPLLVCYLSTEDIFQFSVTGKYHEHFGLISLME